MRATVVVVATWALWAAGCQENEHFPPGEGGGPGGGGGSERMDGGPDAGGSDAGDELDGGSQLSGRLCDPDDLREPLADCADTDLSGIDVVELGSNQSDDTDSEGRFTLAVDLDDDPILVIGRDDPDTRDALVPVALWRGTELVIPRISQAAWDSLMADLGLEQDGTASIAFYLRSGGAPVAGSAVDSDPAAPRIFYDDADAAASWSQEDGATGPAGAALLLDVPVDRFAELTVAPTADNLTVPVAAQHLTLARLDLR